MHRHEPISGPGGLDFQETPQAPILPSVPNGTGRPGLLWICSTVSLPSRELQSGE